MLQLQPLDETAIAELLRDIHVDDAMELRAAGVSDVTTMLRDSAAHGFFASAARWRGDLIAVFGLARWPADATVGVPWLLCTRKIDQAPTLTVARACRTVLADMEGRTPVLVNMAHFSHKRALQLVQWLGFEVDPAPAGPGGEFRFFRTGDGACAIQ